MLRNMFVSAPLLAALMLLAAASPSAASSCAPPGAKTTRLVGEARVYTTSKSDQTKTFVCSDRTGKRARLATRFYSPRGPVGEVVSTFRFAGQYVAAAVEYHDSYSNPWDVLIRRIDLEDGGQLKLDLCPKCTRSSGPANRDWRVTDLVLNRKGLLAWIARTTTRPDRYFVARHDSRGNALLDGGTDIEPRSLGDSGTTIFWIAHGGPQDQDLY